MGSRAPLLLLGLLLLLLLDAVPPAWAGGRHAVLHFTGAPINLTVSQGHGIKLNCSLKGMKEPEIQWLKDGMPVVSADQMYIPVDEDHWISFLSLKAIERPDAGRYWCEAEVEGKRAVSQEIWITVEGVPYFTVEPQDMAVLPGSHFNLSCAAVGPPEPIKIVWWMGDTQLKRATEDSLSTLTVPGIQQDTFFSCEAHNQKGLSSSRTATVRVKALPLAPFDVLVTNIADTNANVSWSPGFDGYSPLQFCTVQVTELHSSRYIPPVIVPVPPFASTLQGLQPASNYSICVQCVNERGASPFTDGLFFQTLESAPSIAPLNIRLVQEDSGLVLEWEEVALNVEKEGPLEYKLQWIQDNVTQGEISVQGTKANLTAWDPLKNLTVRVCALNSAGCGPWSDPLLIATKQKTGKQGNAQNSMSWVPLVLGVLTALVTMVAMTLIFLRKRRKETRFGQVFGSVLGRGGPVVHFTAARSFNRRGPEPMDATLDNIGISDELKMRLKDVLIQQQQFTLGRTLGKGEFGSVREAQLKLEDGSFQKVAVKMLKADVFCSSDIEEFLREAAYMKEFDHPNVTKLIGVSLRSRPKGRLPVPMVILPFMKHGDLHTFLLMSRIGEEPFNIPIQTLIRFMIDICSGMEYLSAKNFIHRDLASRNCMLNENMSVCVADFGLSKKIYSGDYYRQGCASKLPVKWLALESLSDNVFTTYSDVWAFGVTMWEIVTRGQVPYAGVENSEIYHYLIGGNRLKQPPDCLDDLYEMMGRCWNSDPKMRPNFSTLKRQLETILGRLSVLSASQDILYVNIGESAGALGHGCALHDPFEHEEEEDESGTDASESAIAAPTPAPATVSSDYRYILNPGCLREEDDWQSNAHAEEASGLLLADEEAQEEQVVINL
ncbi:tyrosine-protein kinase receptor TYRO3 [Microcaecilia unicolor]|uniref:Tyrosine-protein kinase receptor TYRO3 n=1 Tax=Microcaecilia unicolor TaxID=1415580 RepID=A0A6P7Z1I9_9AMPH|nr:tyrosine-protein kinase receptor TYRO3 [Microcaecilia unicolor]